MVQSITTKEDLNEFINTEVSDEIDLDKYSDKENIMNIYISMNNFTHNYDRYSL